MALIWLLLSVAHAYTTTVCAELSNNFTEEECEGSTCVGFGDLWTKQLDPKVPLRGAKIKVLAYNASGVYQGLARDAFAGSDGCTGFTSTPGWSYLTYVYSEAMVNGVHIQVHPDEVSDDLYWAIRAVDPENGWHYFPTSSETIRVMPSFTSEWAAMAVAGLMMHRNNFGIDACACTPVNECGKLVFANVSTGSGGGNGSYQERIIVNSGRKMILAHEIGHSIVRKLDGCYAPVDEWDAPSTSGNYYLQEQVACDATTDDHAGSGVQDGPLALEWQSVTLKEGWADFVAVWMWNSRDVACEMCGSTGGGGTADLDKDDNIDWPNEVGNVDPTSNCWRLDCEGTPQDYANMTVESYVTTRDWLENLVDHADGGGEECHASLQGVGTSYDVTRYLWDMYTDGGVSMGVLANVYDGADPHDWVGRIATGSNAANMPYQRWLGFLLANHPALEDEHDDAKSNGMDHPPHWW